MKFQTRRSFLKTSSGLLCAIPLAAADFPSVLTQSNRRYRAAVIGRTGRGDYGHGYDLIFQGLSGVSVEAVADENPEGLRKAAQRIGAKRSYRDFREMLAKEKPDLVSIAPRQPDCHTEMALAAIDVGASIFIEKPLTESVSDADRILKATRDRGVKIAVAHVRRFTAEFTQIKALLGDGFVGTVLECRVQGKQDSRVGGEDMIVLGTHDFDIMRFYFGDPISCSADVFSGGRPATLQDVRQGREPIYVAGDTIRASYTFPNNLQCYWNSVKTADHWNGNFGSRQKWQFEIRGSKRIIIFQPGLGTAYLDSPFMAHKDESSLWKDLPSPENWVVPDLEKHPIQNLIHAIETDSQPLCSGIDGRWAVEMVSAVYQSHFKHARVEFPLKDRENPLLPG